MEHHSTEPLLSRESVGSYHTPVFSCFRCVYHLILSPCSRSNNLVCRKHCQRWCHSPEKLWTTDTVLVGSHRCRVSGLVAWSRPGWRDQSSLQWADLATTGATRATSSPRQEDPARRYMTLFLHSFLLGPDKPQPDCSGL